MGCLGSPSLSSNCLYDQKAAQARSLILLSCIGLDDWLICLLCRLPPQSSRCYLVPSDQVQLGSSSTCQGVSAKLPEVVGEQKTPADVCCKLGLRQSHGAQHSPANSNFEPLLRNACNDCASTTRMLLGPIQAPLRLKQKQTLKNSHTAASTHLQTLRLSSQLGFSLCPKPSLKL